MDDPTANPEQPFENNQNNQEENDYRCAFCYVILYGGMDDNDMMHCQGCHRIWDGNAQCPCNFDS